MFSSFTYKKIGEGSCADIYLIEDEICMKEYKDILDLVDPNNNYRLSPKVFDILRTIRSPYFIHLLEKNEYKNKIYNYMYEYIKEEKIDTLDLTREYILHSLNELEHLSEEITEAGIMIQDTNGGNVLTTEEGLTIIDPDIYKEITCCNNILTIQNKKSMLKYLYQKIISNNGVKQEDLKVFSDIFLFDVEKDTDLAYTLSKRLTKDKPRDYIKR